MSDTKPQQPVAVRGADLDVGRWIGRLQAHGLRWVGAVVASVGVVFVPDVIGQLLTLPPAWLVGGVPGSGPGRADLVDRRGHAHVLHACSEPARGHHVQAWLDQEAGRLREQVLARWVAEGEGPVAGGCDPTRAGPSGAGDAAGVELGSGRGPADPGSCAARAGGPGRPGRAGRGWTPRWVGRTWRCSGP